MHTQFQRNSSTYSSKNSTILSVLVSLKNKAKLCGLLVPKKDSHVRWISDFRALSMAIVHRNYPIPKIQDILSHCSGYKFLTKLDLSMQYYTFELDDTSKDLGAIATPFGLYHYAHLPIGVSTSPDLAQEIMEQVLKPGAHPWVGNPEVTGIPQVDSSTRQRQLISTQAEVTYLTKPPITTKPVVRTN